MPYLLAEIWKKSTCYFMAFASARRRTNRIKELVKDDGGVVKEEAVLTNYVCSFFRSCSRQMAAHAYLKFLKGWSHG